MKSRGFKKNDYVLFNTNNVCKINNINNGEIELFHFKWNKVIYTDIEDISEITTNDESLLKIGFFEIEKGVFKITDHFFITSTLYESEKENYITGYIKVNDYTNIKKSEFENKMGNLNDILNLIGFDSNKQEEFLFDFYN